MSNPNFQAQQVQEKQEQPSFTEKDKEIREIIHKVSGFVLDLKLNYDVNRDPVVGKFLKRVIKALEEMEEMIDEQKNLSTGFKP